MMLAVVRRAEAEGLAQSQMFLSMERNMICAARLCGLCQFGPEFVCRDGPVFPYDRIARFLAIPNL
jgi:NAD(P)H-flavin reductase